MATFNTKQFNVLKPAKRTFKTLPANQNQSISKTLNSKFNSSKTQFKQASKEHLKKVIKMKLDEVE